MPSSESSDSQTVAKSCQEAPKKIVKQVPLVGLGVSSPSHSSPSEGASRTTSLLADWKNGSQAAPSGSAMPQRIDPALATDDRGSF
jgi:hypothetical protein